MGRKVTHEGHAQHEEHADEHEQQAEPKLEGGALGVPDAKHMVDGAQIADSNQVFAPSTAKKYQVMSTKRINGAGGITHLHQGQTIDDNNYDIEALKHAGVELKEEA